jgi:hypothetical protein
MEIVSAPLSQTDQILAHLEAGNTITPLDALAKFHCFRLAARINELREAGYKIVTGERKLSTGKTIAEYRMDRREGTRP